MASNRHYPLLLWVGLAPVLLFPDIVPSAFRTAILTSAASIAFIAAAWTVAGERHIRVALVLIAAAYTASWIFMPRDLVGGRHFGGVAAGTLALAVVSRLSNTEQRLRIAAMTLACGSSGVLLLGLLGTSISPKVIGGPPGWDTFLPWLPSINLNLPGLEGYAGRVNPNALGGTAAMVLPFTIGLLATGFIGTGSRRPAVITGGLSSLVATIVLLISHSRTALLATVVTAIVLALRWRGGRTWIARILLLAIAATAVYTYACRRVAPDEFREGITFARSSLAHRTAIFSAALDGVAGRPVFGVGVSQFHQATVPDGPYQQGFATVPVAHAHNIFLQVALDAGPIALAGYVLLIGAAILAADRSARTGTPVGVLAAGAGLSLVAVHIFGLGDAIAPGAKVGLFQWVVTGLIVAAAALTSASITRQGLAHGLHESPSVELRERGKREQNRHHDGERQQQEDQI